MSDEISILGCGWLGKPLAFHLSSLGHRVYGSNTTEHKLETLKEEGITPFIVDIKKINETISKFLTSEILIILITSKDHNDFKKLIAEIEISAVKKVIFISSTSVYYNSNGIVTENSKVKNVPLISIEKLFLENPYFKTNVIRFGGLVGYDRDPANFFAADKLIKNPGGYINMIHRDDSISLINQMIFKINGNWGEVYNACSDYHPERRAFYTEQFTRLGKSTPKFDENSTNEYKIVDSDKLKIDYGYKLIRSKF